MSTSWSAEVCLTYISYTRLSKVIQDFTNQIYWVMNPTTQGAWGWRGRQSIVSPCVSHPPADCSSCPAQASAAAPHSTVHPDQPTRGNMSRGNHKNLKLWVCFECKNLHVLRHYFMHVEICNLSSKPGNTMYLLCSQNQSYSIRLGTKHTVQCMVWCRSTCSSVVMHHAAMCLTAVKWEQRAVRRRGRSERRDYMIFRTCRP